MSKALTEKQNYNLRELLQIVDHGITEEYCHDCTNCGMKLDEEVEVFINGHSHKIWCYSYLLTCIRVELPLE